MDTVLQESGGLARTAPVQSPVPVRGQARLTSFQRAVVGLFVAVLALGYLVLLLPQPGKVQDDPTAPASPEGMP